MAARPDLTILPGGAVAPLRFRRLGRLGDLDLDLAAADRPRVVTAVLSACAVPAQEVGTIWALTLAARIGGLLAVWSSGTGAEALDLRLRCPMAGCGADLEAGLPVEALMALARDAEAVAVLDEGADGGALRRPTGTDQRRWREVPADDPEGVILASLVLRGPVPADAGAREALADRLAAFDPLSCFAVTVHCPDCGTESTHPVDLEAELLARLARMQDRLFAEVDVLARRYGWSDEAILSMPPRRRARYLQMDAAGEGWM
ncbi:MAG: hypothetical protein WAT25_16165 [Paracoccaceae bacterium]|jgi:hypothetical protein|nr:hypothetical protein [Rhodobacter sp.]